jgi:hypothetical protein
MKVGDKVKIVKKTFLHNGIFVLTNSIVEIVDIAEDGYHVVYKDKEGNPHILKLQVQDLTSV